MRLSKYSQLVTIKLLDFFLLFPVSKISFPYNYAFRLFCFCFQYSKTSFPLYIFPLHFSVFSVITLTEVWTKGSLSGSLSCRSIDDWVFSAARNTALRCYKHQWFKESSSLFPIPLQGHTVCWLWRLGCSELRALSPCPFEMENISSSPTFICSSI